MSKMTARTGLMFLLVAAAAVLLAASLKFPLWHLKMEAPQYQGNEALGVHVYAGHMTGDLREIGVLNHYIGVHVPTTLPQFGWLPVVLCAGAAAGLFLAFVPRKIRGHGWVGLAIGLSLAVLAAAAQAQVQMHRIGHARDEHAPLKGVNDFTPPLLGSVKVANFQITSSLGAGAFLIAVAIVLQAGAGFLSAARAPARINTSLKRGLNENGRRQTCACSELPASS